MFFHRLADEAAQANAKVPAAITMGMQDIITTKLMAAFAPESLHVEDESHLHEGHAGHRPGGESHFRLYIVSSAFKGKSRLERHRMINAALANEMKGRVHALAIHAQAPGENAQRQSR
jgi:BolA family transcriptional regulator, general stress-responsive regulator